MCSILSSDFLISSRFTTNSISQLQKIFDEFFFLLFSSFLPFTWYKDDLNDTYYLQYLEEVFDAISHEKAFRWSRVVAMVSGIFFLNLSEKFCLVHSQQEEYRTKWELIVTINNYNQLHEAWCSKNLSPQERVSIKNANNYELQLFQEDH